MRTLLETWKRGGIAGRGVATALSLVAVAAVIMGRPTRARAQSAGDAAVALDASEAHLEDRLADGTLDADDLAAFAHLGRHVEGGRGGPARSWLSLVGFAGELANGTREAGALAIVSFAFDRAAAAATRPPPRFHAPSFVAEGAPPVAPPSGAPGAPSTGASTSGAPPSREPGRDESPLLLSPALARAAVGAAWRQAGLEASDARIDAIVARARLSAILPETRLRAMRSFDEHESTNVAADQGTYYDAAGARLWLEARLTWRFDRLLYADDEPTLERVRMERQEARARVASRVLELLFQWQRARLDLQATQLGSRAELEATLRALEAETALDIVTGGWFSTRAAR